MTPQRPTLQRLHPLAAALCLTLLTTLSAQAQQQADFSKVEIKTTPLATGDYYRSTGYPVVDLINGGTLKGLLDGLGATIALAGPKTRIVPGHGPVVDRTALIAHRDLLLAVRDKVAPLVAQGKTVEEVIATKPTADFDAQVPQAAQTSERFLRWLYAELKAGA